jgi:hypothetical protein
LLLWKIKRERNGGKIRERKVGAGCKLEGRTRKSKGIKNWKESKKINQMELHKERWKEKTQKYT